MIPASESFASTMASAATKCALLHLADLGGHLGKHPGVAADQLIGQQPELLSGLELVPARSRLIATVSFCFQAVKPSVAASCKALAE